MQQFLLTAGALLGMLSVALGAFGAHALRDRLADNLFHSYETAVHYQFIHAITLLVIGVMGTVFPDNKLITTSGTTMLAGTILFSGSLYVLALTNLRYLGGLPFGLVTPVGGSILIISWLMLLIACLKLSR